ncbi:HAD family hydrolase [Thiosulfativibrio zosterae]|uniref:Hydrolase n=1 Tax=Thiosulfativibrio zosterae TaxID=2675053 RepID=A0A6F8PP49_9GAMM|nr:HAD-IIIA family hydrolase [Thiosulfativibrio zosterae]BBP43818.1 hydrolase [Thiosulfativibrio zosterae]
MTTKQYQCVIFDWDGTLMNSEARIVTSIQAAAAKCGFPVLSAFESKQIIGLSLENAIRALYTQADEAQVQCMANAYSQHFLQDSNEQMETFSGALELLAALREQGVKVAIATGKSRRGLDQVLREYSMGHLFDMTRTPHESASKPNPLMLSQILEAFKLQPHQAVMVGDTEFDMEMAHRIGMDRVGLTHGVHEADRLQKFAPLKLFDDLAGLQAWLLENCQAYQA